MAPYSYLRGMWKWVFHPLSFIGLMAVLGWTMAFENRASLSSSLQINPDDIFSGSNMPSDDERAYRTKDDITAHAKRLSRQALLMHRRGDSWEKILAKLGKPDDPVIGILRGVISDAKVSDDFILESLGKWTKGKPVLALGSEWGQERINVKLLMEKARQQGVPVEKLLREKERP